jgi:hypothetical protein
MTRESWRRQWLNCINELTSLELQNKSWLDEHSSPRWGFVEFMCGYFDDLLINDQEYQTFIDEDWLTKEEFSTIRHWHDSLAQYEPPNNNEYDERAILADPHWIAIVNIGQLAKYALAQMLTPPERQILIRHINHPGPSDFER